MQLKNSQTKTKAFPIFPSCLSFRWKESRLGYLTETAHLSRLYLYKEIWSYKEPRALHSPKLSTYDWATPDSPSLAASEPDLGADSLWMCTPS